MIAFQLSAEGDLCVVTYSGTVTLADHAAFIEQLAGDRALLACDVCNVLTPDCVFSDMTIERLDTFREQTKRALRATGSPLTRRTAWLCQSAQARPFLEHWLQDRFTNDGLFATPLLVDTLEDAAEWLIRPVDQLAELISGGSQTATPAP